MTTNRLTETEDGGTNIRQYMFYPRQHVESHVKDSMLIRSPTSARKKVKRLYQTISM